MREWVIAYSVLQAPIVYILSVVIRLVISKLVTRKIEQITRVN